MNTMNENWKPEAPEWGGVLNEPPVHEIHTAVYEALRADGYNVALSIYDREAPTGVRWADQNGSPSEFSLIAIRNGTMFIYDSEGVELESVPTHDNTIGHLVDCVRHTLVFKTGAIPRSAPADAMFEVTRTLTYRGTLAWLSKTRERGNVPWQGIRPAGGHNTITSTATEPVLVTDREIAVEKLREQAKALGVCVVEFNDESIPARSADAHAKQSASLLVLRARVCAALELDEETPDDELVGAVRIGTLGLVTR